MNHNGDPLIHGMTGLNPIKASTKTSKTKEQFRAKY